jgi:deoxyribodipyrimidine photo-lyase
LKRVIHWFRRDLRLHDNTALSDACRRAEQVIPVFILEEALRTGPDVGAARLAFLLRSAQALREELRQLGSDLIVRSGNSVEEIPKLAAELKANAVFCNSRYEFYARKRDGRICGELERQGIGFECFKDAVIWTDEEILTQAGKPFTVFTPYAKAWKARRVPSPRPAPTASKLRLPSGVRCGELPTDSAAFGHPCTQAIPEPGEAAALKRWETFRSNHLYAYADARNRCDIDGTSQLSVHLRAGTIGIREVLAGLNESARSASDTRARESCESFRNELIWREFYQQVMHNFPHVIHGAFRREYDALAWSDNEAHFAAWCEGQTGYPIVDAAMRCLKATGWMHNRLRMIVAMFLTKDLHLNWQHGERYFMQQLVDGDAASNNGGWQWSASTGTDAAPYFRIFNPVSQGQKCDPQGTFVRHWVPELANVPDDVIHEPWTEPLLAPNYARRIVLHEVEREKTLALFKRVKG